MTGPTSRGSRQAVPATAPLTAPHAALLIDFDNVTLGIRSDLTKELKTLLNSDIIRGKVAVQRAYADWRRYPQYIVPLSERSIDLIFATAVGSTKKNATDIRLAIDAIELVFTRPEIGTFILLSGDSDFSALVIKLKEYGKYVIGVGIRESASDLLIQNCDEYYSYSELAGLNKELDAPSVQRDPWDLVREAVTHMARQGDVMRSDRLKQVMQQLDPNFDERNAGFNRFSKFVTEAGTRGLLKINKLDNGQFEVSPLDELPAPAASVELPARAPDENGRRGRSRRGRDRERGSRAPRGGDADSPPSPPPPAAPGAAHRESQRPRDRLTLGAAFALLGRALGELAAPVRHDALRARMAALHGREDPMLDPSRFSRLLRQANDAEVADVKKVGPEEYEVSPSRSTRARTAVAALGSPQLAAPSEPAEGLPAPAAEHPTAVASPPAAADPSPPAGRAPTLRFRRGSRGLLRPAEIPLVGVVQIEVEEPEPGTKERARPAPRQGGRGGRGGRKGTEGRRRDSSARPKDGTAVAPAGATNPSPSTEPATSQTPTGSRPRRGRGTRKAS